VITMPPLLRPGDVARFIIAYKPGVLIHLTTTLPGAPPLSAVGLTGRDGRVTLSIVVPFAVALHNGRAGATVAVDAFEGTWTHTIMTTTGRVSARSRSQLTVLTPFNQGTPVRAQVSFVGHQPQVYFAATERFGVLKLDVPVPHGIAKGGRAHASVAIWSLRNARRTITRTALNVSDLVIHVDGGPIAHCQQLQVAHVRYRPHTRLQILFSFADSPRFTVTVRTDARGEATAGVRLTYVRADDPLNVDVEVGDTTPQARRVELVSSSVNLPVACRGSTPISVTVGR